METVAIPQAGFAAPRGLRLCSSPPPPVSRCVWTGFGVLLHVEPVTTFFFCSLGSWPFASSASAKNERAQVRQTASKPRGASKPFLFPPFFALPWRWYRVSEPARCTLFPSQADATMTNDSNQIGHLQAQLSNLGC